MSNTAPLRLSNIKETSRALGVSIRTVNTLVSRGEIPSLKVGGLRRFRLDAVLAVLEEAGTPALKEKAAPDQGRVIGEEGVSALLALSKDLQNKRKRRAS